MSNRNVRSRPQMSPGMAEKGGTEMRKKWKKKGKYEKGRRSKLRNGRD